MLIKQVRKQELCAYQTTSGPRPCAADLFPTQNPDREFRLSMVFHSTPCSIFMPTELGREHPSMVRLHHIRVPRVKSACRKPLLNTHPHPYLPLVILWWPNRHSWRSKWLLYRIKKWIITLKKLSAFILRRITPIPLNARAPPRLPIVCSLNSWRT